MAVLLGVVVGTPTLRLEAPTLTWIITLGVIALALTHIALFRRRSSSHFLSRPEPQDPPREPRKEVAGGPGHAHPPSLYKGRSHSGERPRFD